MKKLLTLLFFIGCYQFSIAQFSAGGGLSYISNSNSALGLQGRISLGFSEKVVGSGVYNYYFNDVGSVFDIDVHYVLLRSDAGFELSPMAGIRVMTGNGADTNLQLGLFSVLRIDKFKVYLEPKYVLTTDDAFVISAGLMF